MLHLEPDMSLRLDMVSKAQEVGLRGETTVELASCRR